MQIASILSYLESLAPRVYQEGYDNAGLLTGQGHWECSGVLTTLDVVPETVEEAAARGCNLIVAHHPLIFGGLKKLTGSNMVERAVIAAIKQDIAIYAIHTNLDNVLGGVNGVIADRLGLAAAGRAPLLPREGVLQKLFCFVPEAHAEAVRNALFAAGGGHIGNYSECSYHTEGVGTFKGGEGTRPFVGAPGRRHEERELRIEVVLPAHLSRQVIRAMVAAHPYEEPAFDLVDLANTHPGVGSGLVGELPEALPEGEFLARIKGAFGLQILRHTSLRSRPVKRVAVCGGAGSFLVSNALAEGADFFVSSDFKYHEFFRAEGRLVIADIGHYESEQFTIDWLAEVLRGKFLNFAVLKSDVKTNPVHYY